MTALKKNPQTIGQTRVPLLLKRAKEGLIASYTVTGQVTCPVRTSYYGKTKKYQCHEIPLQDIHRDIREQMRRQDSCPQVVSEIQEDIEINGQEQPIAVEWDSAKSKFVVVWGHTRFRAVSGSNLAGTAINGLPAGVIKAFIIAVQSDLKEELKTIENCIHPPRERATPKDVASQVKRMIRRGVFGTLSQFEQLTLAEQRAKVKDWVDLRVPSYGGKKFTGIWNIVKKDVSQIAKKKRTWDKAGDMCDYFNTHNPLGIVHTGSFKPGTVFTIDRKDKDTGVVKRVRIAVYLATAKSEFTSNLTANSQWKKNVPPKEADEVVVVAALNDGSDTDLANRRTTCTNNLKKWNAALPINSMDRILWIPQSEDELDNALLTNNPWVKDVTL